MPEQPTRRGEFVLGMRLLGRGFGMYARNPGLMVFGMLPALLALIVVALALVLLLVFIDELSALLTWFADDWSAPWRALLRFAVGAALLAGSILLAVVTFTGLTLAFGEPFYERIARGVDQRLGDAPDEPELPWHRSVRNGLADAGRTVMLSLALGVPLFAIGLIPVVGQVLAPVGSALVASWLLTLELTGIAFDRRGLRLAARRRALRAHRPAAIGFGLPVFLACLIPLAAIAVIPAAVAGATLLTRHVLGESAGPLRPRSG